MKKTKLMLMVLSLFISLNLSAQKQESNDHYYVFYENGTYGWDHDDGSIFLAKYLGKRHNVAQFSIPVSGENNTQIAIIRPPFEFMTIVNYKNLEYVDKRVGRIQEGSVVYVMVIDAFKDKLTPPSYLFDDIKDFLWVDKNLKIKKLSRAEFNTGPEY